MGLVEKRSRDEHGLVIVSPEAVAPERDNRPPVAVTTRRQAEALGWSFVVAEKPSLVALGGGLIEQRTGRYVAEWTGSVGTGMPTTHRREAATLGKLLVQISDFELRRRS